MSDVAAPAPAATPASAPAAPAKAAPSSAAPEAPITIPESGSTPDVPKASKSNYGVPDAKLPMQDGVDAAKPADAKAEAAAEKAAEIQRMKLKTKVNGREMEREYTAEELTLLAQKGMGADEKFQKAAQLQKTFQSFIEAVKQDPFAAFNDPAFGDLGGNFKNLVIQRLQKEFEMEELAKADPRAYELQQYKEKAERLEAAEKKREADARAAAQEEADKRYWAETKKSWNAALEKAGLAENDHFIREMARVGQDFLEKGLDLNPEHLVAELREQMASQHKLIMGGLKGEKLLSFLGDEVVNEILAYKVQQVKAARKEPEPLKAPEPAAPKASDDDKFMKPINSLRAFRDFLREE